MNMRAIVLNDLDEGKIASILKEAVGNHAPNENWNDVAKQIAEAVKPYIGANGQKTAEAVAVAVAATEGPFPNEAGVEEELSEEEEQALQADELIYHNLPSGYRPFPKDNGVACQKCGDTEVKGFYRDATESYDEHVEWLCHGCGAVYQTATKGE